MEDEVISFGKGMMSASDVDRIIKEVTAFKNTIEMNIATSKFREDKINEISNDIRTFQYSMRDFYKDIFYKMEKHIHDFIVLTEITSENTPDRAKFIESLHKDRLLLKSMI